MRASEIKKAAHFDWFTDEKPSQEMCAQILCSLNHKNKNAVRHFGPGECVLVNAYCRKLESKWHTSLTFVDIRLVEPDVGIEATFYGSFDFSVIGVD